MTPPSRCSCGCTQFSTPEYGYACCECGRIPDPQQTAPPHPTPETLRVLALHLGNLGKTVEQLRLQILATSARLLELEQNVKVAGGEGSSSRVQAAGHVAGT